MLLPGPGDGRASQKLAMAGRHCISRLERRGRRWSHRTQAELSSPRSGEEQCSGPGWHSARRAGLGCPLGSSTPLPPPPPRSMQSLAMCTWLTGMGPYVEGTLKFTQVSDAGHLVTGSSWKPVGHEHPGSVPLCLLRKDVGSQARSREV